MRDIGGEKVEKDFMIIQEIKRRAMAMSWATDRRLTKCFKFCLGVILLVQFNSCSPDLGDDPIPIVPFADITIQLNLPEYALKLSTDGGTKEIKGGVRGIILYRKNASTYIAFEKNCSYHPNEASATVEVHSSTLYLWDPNCGSTFRFPDGQPSGGAAWRPLQQYVTLLSGTTLTITSDVVVH
jgi:hypothetical protein